MKVNRVVLDTNVLISALPSYQVAARKTLDIVRNHGTLIFSEEPFTELLTSLYRPKFDPYVTDNQRSEYLANLIDMSKWIAIQNRAMGCRDSDDDNFLETALISDADALISGDSVCRCLNKSARSQYSRLLVFYRTFRGKNYPRRVYTPPPTLPTENP